MQEYIPIEDSEYDNLSLMNAYRPDERRDRRQNTEVHHQVDRTEFIAERACAETAHDRTPVRDRHEVEGEVGVEPVLDGGEVDVREHYFSERNICIY